jgi:hypothetical protein
MELPYDLSFSHHQLLFIVFIVIYGTNMEIVFTKSKQNDIFTELVDKLVRKSEKSESQKEAAIKFHLLNQPFTKSTQLTTHGYT